MRKILDTIKQWLFPTRYEITPKGKYFCYYLINKYIDERNKNDHNAEYEKSVSKMLEKIEPSGFFSTFKDAENNIVNLSDDDKRAFAAMFCIIRILYGCDKKSQDNIYGYIEDKEMVNFMKRCIDNGVGF